MRHAIFLLLFALTTSISAMGQFGGLSKVLDKAKTLSDLEISDEDERALGEAVSQNIRQVYGVQQDEAATRYVTLVGKVVAARSSRPKLDYQFIILDSDSTNAFAAPGGFIHITRGALAIMSTEAELAGVLAHEIAHVTERHTIKGLQKMKGIEIANEETSITSNSELFAQLTSRATEAVLQGFGRAEELESDEVGVEFAAKCGYNPHGLTGFLTALQARYSERQARAGLFASHPESKERLQKIEKTISKEKLEQKGTLDLSERFSKSIQYELASFVGTGQGVEGAKGMAGSEPDKEKKEEEEDSKSKKSGGFLGKMKNPFGSGEKQERAEVTGSAAARGVETELGVEEPGNAAQVVVQVTKEELDAFRAEGGLA